MEESCEPPLKKVKLMENAAQDEAVNDSFNTTCTPSDLEIDTDDEEWLRETELSAQGSSPLASRDEDESPSSSPKGSESGFSLHELTPKVASIALPPVKPSKNPKKHVVCYELPWKKEEQPKPHPSVCTYGADLTKFVALPYYSKITRRSTKETHWSEVKKALEPEILNIKDLIKAIQSCSQNAYKYGVLEALFDPDSEYDSYQEDEIKSVFTNIIPGIQDLALQLPSLVTAPLPYLKAGESISLSQKQVASLLANAFFCTYLPRSRHTGDLPAINFNGLYKMPYGDQSYVECNMEKLKCIFHYFKRVLKEEPNGVITYHRRQIAAEDFPIWQKSNEPIKKLCVVESGTIESEGTYMLQMDFANKFLGGGVLGQGCVQEEIRFAICPEFIVGCLFMKVMDKNEAIIICGAEQYSKYSGYGSEFKWSGSFKDTTERDASGRRCTSLVAIDAIPLYRDRGSQYRLDAIHRELNKAYAGFYRDPNCDAIPVATGNWGCGVFGGDPRFKSILQLLAASQCGRDTVYFTFRDKTLVKQLRAVHKFLLEKNATVGEVYKTLLAFKRTRENQDFLKFLENNFGKINQITKYVSVGDKNASPLKEKVLKDEKSGSPLRRADSSCPDTVIDMPPDEPDLTFPSESKVPDAADSSKAPDDGQEIVTQEKAQEVSIKEEVKEVDDQDVKKEIVTMEEPKDVDDQGVMKEVVIKEELKENSIEEDTGATSSIKTEKAKRISPTLKGKSKKDPAKNSETKRQTTLDNFLRPSKKVD